MIDVRIRIHVQIYICYMRTTVDDLIFILNWQTRVSSFLYGQENQQMLVAVGICFLATAILVAAVIVFLLRNRYVARQKLKDLTQPTDTEATRDYQVFWINLDSISLDACRSLYRFYALYYTIYYTPLCLLTCIILSIVWSITKK